jgi:hypothetical protein
MGDDKRHEHRARARRSLKNAKALRAHAENVSREHRHECDRSSEKDSQHVGPKGSQYDPVVAEKPKPDGQTLPYCLSRTDERRGSMPQGKHRTERTTREHHVDAERRAGAKCGEEDST